MENWKEVLTTIKAIAKENKVTHAMLGKSVGINASNITHTLNGSNIPSLKKTLDLAEAAGVDIELLIKSIKNKREDNLNE